MCRSPIAATSGAITACRRSCRNGFPARKFSVTKKRERIIRIAAGLGVTKVRVTGGEPLTRRDVIDFIRAIPRIPGIRSLGLSTNGTLLAREVEPAETMAAALREAGVQSVNISLDTLDREVYTRKSPGAIFIQQALEGIAAAIAAGFEQIKLNAVLMRGRNEDQLIPLIEFAAAAI